MLEEITYTCACEGAPSPGTICAYTIKSNKFLCGYPGFCEFRCEGCQECGAKNQQEAEIKCICSGDKDDCQGCHIWPD